ncbi:MAG: polysaccharide deacetylase family protein [Clostridiaceae bacterium]|nr:polysaccharide deacetylase family protein [Clostridiaceae bacterium]
MRIYIIKLKTIIAYGAVTLALIILAAMWGITGMKPLEVFSQGREIPIYSVECEEKKASITFDCAWGADDIPRILEILENENVKATFFIVGQWAEKNPQYVKMIADKGHDIANHSYSHLRMGVLDTDRIEKEILLCSQKLEELTGKKVDLFRAPYGDYNNNVIRIARKLNHHVIQWSLDSLDWKPGITQEEILDRITKRIKPGAVILFHNDTPHTAKLLPTIIATLKKDGYSLVPVSELIMRESYYIDHAGVQRRK